MTQKPGKRDDVTCLNRNFWHFWLPHVKTNGISGILRKTGQDRYVFKRTFWVSKFDFLPELDLTLGQIWKWVSPSNSTSQKTHKTCVTRHSCYTFMRWPHLTWSWPWRVLSINLLLTWHLRHLFSSSLAWFGLAAVSGQVSLADKAMRVSFDLLHDIDPILDLAKIILRLY